METLNLKKLILLFAGLIYMQILFAQNELHPQPISDMKWGVDYNIHIKLSNDSNYIFDVSALYHSKTSINDSLNDVTYYPVSLDRDFVNQLKTNKINSNNDTIKNIADSASNSTLWSALHTSIGGGWIHFINCTLYSLESQQLSITAPLMKRIKSQWRPKPMTESFKRTRKWEYYVPVNQKYAIKEYKIRKRKNQLADINSVPPDFIELFLKTNNKKYNQLRKEHKYNKLAKIDLIKILLGANYLSKIQIEYIRSCVLNSVLQYSVNQLPSVIIFDDFNAAVAMTLSKKGYNIEKIVFNDIANLDEEQIIERKRKITEVVNPKNS
ncbi:MAG: hypothetical protein DRJ01_14755 [Bacteroidetes bacterium]|nr:MAG: hypothetical protein DRJ01_14755 [Bacteroidota bacterium]